MAEMRWTPAQAAAIEDEGGALLVSAAAGSGKTAVLVERAVRLITRERDPVPADRLLIVTFTNAAAEELRARIAGRLEAELQHSPGSLVLRRQRLLLRRAFVGTIDAFCQQLVREHFTALGLPPDVMVGDAALLASLADTAISAAMEQMYAQSEDFVRFCSLYGRARSDAAAEAAVRDLYEFTRTLPHPAAQLGRFEAMYQDGVPLARSAWGEYLLGYAQQALDSARALCGEAQRLAAGEEALAAYLPMLAADAASIEALGSLLGRGEWDGCLAFLAQHRFAALKAVRTTGGAKERVRALREGVKKIFKDLHEGCFVCTQSQFEADRDETAPLVAALCQAVRRFEQRYHEEKLAEKILDFADFEQLALGLLQDESGARTEVAEAVSARYDVVMVDEYQDTNELQSALYDCLARADGSNLFLVGDIKQSIYRFRKANPGIFLAKKHSFAPYETGAHPAVLTLGHNFRSGRGVIEGVNYVFGALMSPGLGDIAYEGEERLIQGREGGDETGLALHIVEGESDAGFVADTIVRMVREGYPVREGEGSRPAEFGDFCILLRARKHMLDYEAALSARGVPAVADMAGELLETPEVLPLVSALCAIDNPADDVSLAAALLGPLFGFTATQLARVRAGAPRVGLYGSLLASEEPRAVQALETLRFYRALSGGVSVGRLCEELCRRTGYLSAVRAMEGGEGRLDNLLRFLQWAREVSAAGRGGLSGFVRLIQNGRGPQEGGARGLPGHVSLLSVHKSKGLEFPVCILADAGHAFNRMDRAARVQMHAQLGLGLLLREGDTLFHTLPSLAIRARSTAEAMSEEMRILYVALTRAKERMIITLPKADPARYLARLAATIGPMGPDAYQLARGQSFADWLCAAALCHPDAGALLACAGAPDLPRITTQSRWVMSVEAPPQGAEPGAEFEATAPADAALVALLRAGFAKAPARAALAAVPRKVSVSQLAKGAAGESPLKRPSFMYKTGLSAAERGSAQHAFLQHADFARAEADPAAEAQRLAEAGLLPNALAQHIDTAGLAHFFASPLYARVQSAQRVLREYDFITSLPAGEIDPQLAPALAAEPVLVQGIADLVLVGDEGFELVDYKTDRGAGPEVLRARYAKQLALYKLAVERRLALPCVRVSIWSFALNAEVPL